jgi:cytochrome c oxidase assembly protein subunit 15
LAILAPLFSAKRLTTYAWLSLVSQIAIVVTGGFVRLTGSGLGCPTWPSCTADSLVNVPEMGIHGFIEFANRLLTFALVVVAALTLITVFRFADARQLKLRKPSVALLLGIPAQAIIGGISVLTKLNPWVVGLHFVTSGLMIAVAAVLLCRVKGWGSSASATVLSKMILIVGAIAVLVGVAVTGAGPHSGDAKTPRNGLDLEMWQHYHSYPGYLLLLLVVVQVAVLWRAGARLDSLAFRVSALLLATVVFQAVIGVIQSRLGVPPLLVGLHMLGASTAIALLTLQRLVTKAKATA